MSASELRHKIRGRHSVRARIGLACAGLFLVTGAAFVVATYVLVHHGLSYSGVINQTITRQIQDEKALLRACESALHAPPPPARPAALNQKVTTVLAAKCQNLLAGGARLGAADQRSDDLHQLLVWSLVGLGCASVVTGILGWAIGRRILAPLHKVTGAARRASQEHLDERISLDGPRDELKELADTFDDMIDRLDVAFASQRRFVANASHELRTPLTSMRTLIDVAMAKPTRTAEGLEVLVGHVRDALGQSEAIIDGLLTLARSDRGLTVRGLVDLEAAAQDAIDQASTLATTSQVVIEARLSAAPTLGDHVLVERLVANLVDNAVRYNVAGGSVKVETGTDHGQSYLSVTNTGPVVPEPKVASLFEPFTRLDQRVSNGQGVGLGLSIVASVVAAHSGHLQADALAHGGLKIGVRFPTTAPSSLPDLS